MAIISAVLVLGGIGATGAAALNRIAKKFHVEEDPRISEVEACLPGANCGGCGMKGCHDFAVQCVKAGNLDGLYCPVGGSDAMAKITDVMGCQAVERTPVVAVVKCAGTPATKTALNATYVGPRSCAIMNMNAGDYACRFSCLGCGDCAGACQFGALSIDPESGLPVVDADKCTGCGACAKACPRHIIELRPKGLRGRRVWVACSNCLKGAETRKQCTVGCIGCGKCVKTCPFEAITVTNGLAYIDPAKCKACGKCVSVCPTHAINSANIKIIAKKEDENSNV